MSEEELLNTFSPGEIEFESTFTKFWRRLFRPKIVREQRSDPLAFLAANSGNIDRNTLAARFSILQKTDMTPQLSSINASTLIIAGACDRAEILSGSQVLEQQIPGAELEVIEGAGHFCFYTRHDLYNAAVDEFLIRNLPHF